MSNEELKPGDVVELKSGSLKLTVEGVSSEGRMATCRYFHQGTSSYPGEFKVLTTACATLKKVNAPGN